MTFRARVILLGACAAVLTITLAAGLLSTERKQRGEGEPLAPVVPGEVRRIVFERALREGRESIDLSRDDDGEAWWLTVNGELRPARVDRIERFLQDLTLARTARQVTSDRGLWRDFGLDGAGTSTLRLYGEADAELSRIVFGNRAERDREVFVRVGDGNEVYAAAAADILFSMEREKTYWSELRLLPPSLSSSAVTRLEVSSTIAHRADAPPPISYRLELDTAGNWTVIDDDGVRTARQSRARELLAAILSLEGTQFFATDAVVPGVTISAPESAEVDPGGVEPGDGEPEARLGITLRDGSRYEISIRHWHHDGYFIAVASGPGVPLDSHGGRIAYLIPDLTLERVLRFPSALVQ